MVKTITGEHKKCNACGYEYKWNYKIRDKKYADTTNKIIEKGDEDFIKIIGSFGYPISSWPYYREIFLYMCPKCMTVKGDNFKI